MIFINIIAEGYTEEIFIKEVLTPFFAHLDIFVSVRKIQTGWNQIQRKPSKGGLMKYIHLKNDILRWIESDRGKADTYYTTFVDLYAFPQDSESPYSPALKSIENPYKKIESLESALERDINHARFIPYIQLHEFETFLMTEPEGLLSLYPDKQKEIEKLKQQISGLHPEEINDSPQSAPSKRIMQFIPDYEYQKRQVGPMVAQDIGLYKLRQACPHFNDWVSRIEKLSKR